MEGVKAKPKKKRTLDDIHDQIRDNQHELRGLFKDLTKEILHSRRAESADTNEIKATLQEIKGLLQALQPPPPVQATRALMLFGPITSQFTGETMATILTTDQQVHATVAFVDHRGNPATVDGVPVWDTDSPSILSVTAEADGMSALIVALGPLGPAQVSVKADADLGAGLRELAATGDIEIMAAEAVSASVAFGAPEDQP